MLELELCHIRIKLPWITQRGKDGGGGSRRKKGKAQSFQLKCLSSGKSLKANNSHGKAILGGL